MNNDKLRERLNTPAMREYFAKINTLTALARPVIRRVKDQEEKESLLLLVWACTLFLNPMGMFRTESIAGSPDANVFEDFREHCEECTTLLLTSYTRNRDFTKTQQAMRALMASFSVAGYDKAFCTVRPRKLCLHMLPYSMVKLARNAHFSNRQQTFLGGMLSDAMGGAGFNDNGERVPSHEGHA